jgi:sec-independent protein translocase protein TatA
VPFGLGIWEIVILAGILILLFGTKGAPGMAKKLGSSVREMKDAVTDMDPRSILDGKDEKSKAPPRGEIEASVAQPVAPPTVSAPAAASDAPKASAADDPV